MLAQQIRDNWQKARKRATTVPAGGAKAHAYGIAAAANPIPTTPPPPPTLVVEMALLLPTLRCSHCPILLYLLPLLHFALLLLPTGASPGRRAAVAVPRAATAATPAALVVDPLPLQFP